MWTMPFFVLLMLFPIGALTGALANLTVAVCGGLIDLDVRSHALTRVVNTNGVGWGVMEGEQPLPLTPPGRFSAPRCPLPPRPRTHTHTSDSLTRASRFARRYPGDKPDLLGGLLQRRQAWELYLDHDRARVHQCLLGYGGYWTRP